ncbi:MAG: GNAT family N-acetyltransferase [Alphaproteobacteria bacterium]|nr:GNAT family N-acetyltransferase [Alphaproteobacteria bacterium]
MGEPKIRCRPLTAARWGDLERVFGPNGANSGCWCMWFRRPRREWQAAHGRGNRAALKRLVGEKQPLGLLAYVDRAPAGWCAVAPREDYTALAGSRLFPPTGEARLWAITCLFVHRDFRRSGVSRSLIEAAVAYAKRKGAEIVEAYPVVAEGRADPARGYHGFADVFHAAGFEAIGRPSATRARMRVQFR